MTDTEFFIMHGLWCGDEAFVFKSRSDRNEMALSMFQELSYEMFYEYLQNGSRNPDREWNCATDNLMIKMLFRGQASGNIGCDRIIVMAEDHPSDGVKLYGLSSYRVIAGEMSYGEHQTFSFDNESDRNEMALSLFQENEYVYAQHMAHYPEDYGERCVAGDLASEDLECFVATFVDGERDQAKAPKGLRMMPTIDYQDLREALIEEYGELFRGANILDIMFGEFYQNDCAKEYYIWGGEYPVIDYEGCYGDANDSYRRFLIDEYLMRIVPKGVEYIMINICW